MQFESFLFLFLYIILLNVNDMEITPPLEADIVKVQEDSKDERSCPDERRMDMDRNASESNKKEESDTLAKEENTAIQVRSSEDDALVKEKKEKYEPLSRQKRQRASSQDRHSKVQTPNGLRDRRIRLSVSTAQSLYDLQERLKLRHPSEVVDWLLSRSSDTIARLPALDTEKEFNLNLMSSQHALEQPSLYSTPIPSTNVLSRTSSMQSFLESYRNQIDGETQADSSSGPLSSEAASGSVSISSETFTEGLQLTSNKDKESSVPINRSERRVRARERARTRSLFSYQSNLLSRIPEALQTTVVSTLSHPSQPVLSYLSPTIPPYPSQIIQPHSSHVFRSHRHILPRISAPRAFNASYFPVFPGQLPNHTVLPASFSVQPSLHKPILFRPPPIQSSNLRGVGSNVSLPITTSLGLSNLDMYSGVHLSQGIYPHRISASLQNTSAWSRSLSQPLTSCQNDSLAPSFVSESFLIQQQIEELPTLQNSTNNLLDSNTSSSAIGESSSAFSENPPK